MQRDDCIDFLGNHAENLKFEIVVCVNAWDNPFFLDSDPSLGENVVEEGAVAQKHHNDIGYYCRAVQVSSCSVRGGHGRRVQSTLSAKEWRFSAGLAARVVDCGDDDVLARPE